MKSKKKPTSKASVSLEENKEKLIAGISQKAALRHKSEFPLFTIYFSRATTDQLRQSFDSRNLCRFVMSRTLARSNCLHRFRSLEVMLLAHTICKLIAECAQRGLEGYLAHVAVNLLANVWFHEDPRVRELKVRISDVWHHFFMRKFYQFILESDLVLDSLEEIEMLLSHEHSFFMDMFDKCIGFFQIGPHRHGPKFDFKNQVSNPNHAESFENQYLADDPGRSIDISDLIDDHPNYAFKGFKEMLRPQPNDWFPKPCKLDSVEVESQPPKNKLADREYFRGFLESNYDLLVGKVSHEQLKQLPELFDQVYFWKYRLIQSSRQQKHLYRVQRVDKYSLSKPFNVRGYRLERGVCTQSASQSSASVTEKKENKENKKSSNSGSQDQQQTVDLGREARGLSPSQRAQSRAKAHIREAAPEVPKAGEEANRRGEGQTRAELPSAARGGEQYQGQQKKDSQKVATWD